MTETDASTDRRAERAMLHRALGDPTRLAIVEALQLSDRSPRQLADLTGSATNLLAFHLDVLAEVGLVERTVSAGDARRRYVRLVRSRLASLQRPAPLPAPAEHVLFVCTGNSARSQLASHLWHARTGRPALSAGLAPAPRVHPRAVAVARRHGLDLGSSRPRRYDEVTQDPDLVISVCDRAHESSPPFAAPLFHWSVPDPDPGGRAAFEAAFDDLADRVEHLALATTPPAGPPPADTEDPS